MKNGTAKSPRPPMDELPPEPSPAELKKQLADDGRLLELLELIERGPFGGLFNDSMPVVSSCINKLAERDPLVLTDAIIARVLALASCCYVRNESLILKRLKESDGAPREIPGMPGELVEGGALDRAAKIVRFMMEITSLRARIRHLNDLERRHRKKDNGGLPLITDPDDSAICQARFEHEKAQHTAVLEKYMRDHGLEFPHPQPGHKPRRTHQRADDDEYATRTPDPRVA